MGFHEIWLGGAFSQLSYSIGNADASISSESQGKVKGEYEEKDCGSKEMFELSSSLVKISTR